MDANNLQEELRQVDPATEVILAANGALVPVTGVTYVADKSVLVIRGRSKDRYNVRFTTQEDGVLGHLRGLGLSDDIIGEVLGRDPSSVKGRRKRLRLA